MYGPIRPPTNAIGRIAAITVSVARIVGLPTSSTARTAIASRPAAVARHPRVPHDVLDHDDRIVDQDADREDQREERDAVERVAVEIEDEQRERERDGNRGQHDDRLAPAEHEPDQHRHRHDGEEHVPEQLVRLLRGRLAVVARDRDVQVARQQIAARASRPSRSTARVSAIALVPFALGDRQRDGRKRLAARRDTASRSRPARRRRRSPSRRRRDAPACRRLAPTTTSLTASSDVGQLPVSSRRRAVVDDDVARRRSGRCSRASACCTRADRVPRDGERRRIEIDRDLPRPAADDRDLRDVRQLLQRFLELRRPSAAAATSS